MRLYFSNAARWMACGASVADADRIDRPTNRDAANEGIAAAWMAERVVFGDGSPDDFRGEFAPNGVEITGQMVNDVGEYAAWFARIARFALDTGTEHNASIFGVRGRIDAFARLTDRLVIGDLKYGYRGVDPVENWQLLTAACALDRGEPHFDLVIYSPRATPGDPVHTWRIDRDRLLRYRDAIHQRVIALEMGDRDASVGAHCDGCPHAGSCPALGSWIEDHMNTQDLAELHELMQLLKTRVAAIETDTEARLRAGEYVPGWLLEPSMGNRQWRDDPATVAMMTGHVTTKEVARTPGELERDGVPRAVLDKLTIRPPAGVKLRQWKPAKIANIFKD